MLVIGLTGGIASGKSVVGRMLSALGAHIVDADRIAREVVEPGRPALAEIAKTFGKEVLLPDGALDRKKLGAIVFADRERLLQLNAIMLPRIAEEAQARIRAEEARGARAVIYEAALIVENKIHLGLDGLIVTAVGVDTQIERLAKRDGLPREQAEARIRAQAPLADKLAVATWVVHTDGPLEKTREQVARVWAEIVARAEGKQ